MSYEITPVPLTNGHQIYRGTMPWSLNMAQNQMAYASQLSAHRISKVYVLVEKNEMEFADSPNELEFLRNRSIESVHFPLPDGATPTDRDAFKRLIGTIVTDIDENKQVLVHCQGGKGRTGVVIASALKYLIPAQDTIKYLRNFVPGAVETADQRAYVQNFSL